MTLDARWTQVLREEFAADIRALADAYPDERSLYIPVRELAVTDTRLASDIPRQPERSQEAAEAALHDIELPERNVPLGLANVRFTDLPASETFTVGGFSPADTMSRLIDVEGQITKRTEVNPKLQLGAFSCLRCETLTRVTQPPSGMMREPNECAGCELQGPFRLKEAQSEWTNHQKIRLQQPPEQAQGETENIDVHVSGDLAGDDAIEGGTRVTVTGRVTPVYNKGKVVWKKQLIGQAVTTEEDSFAEIDTDAYAEEIETIRTHPNTARLLVSEFAPGHAGDEHIKLALLLQLFGGWARESDGGRYYRGDSHIYLLGDPGTDKTGLLERAYELSPRGAITDGTGSSAPASPQRSRRTRFRMSSGRSTPARSS
ncbi:hypothetical protein [Halosegnis marinus]|uniref:DNA helicase n=1 Tax=Halosegnis marinus TaxID=3034023 RepID=A0ABD5ZTP2_9EURY|nr:hypothetical protein [Halosegnis sp. DT85]